ncbi:MAG TPA: DNA repair protein RadA, partial [Longimicrobiales bacterium]|nr:DNA repair protein RadA [Longimicrobiales bacterium]
MAKTRTIFFCTECGNETPRWQGQCPACSAWNTLVEEPVAPRSKKSSASPNRPNSSQQAARLSDLTTQSEQRWPTGIDEFDFVLGGGVVPGSLILV